MKTFTIILTIITLTISNALASITPEVLVSTADIEVVSVEGLDIFTTTSFDKDSDNLVFDTKSNISVVQIFNAEGIMEFQLPVMSNNVQINTNLFESGKSRLGFILEGETQIHFTEVTLK